MTFKLNAAAAANGDSTTFDPEVFLRNVSRSTTIQCSPKQTIFAQGDLATRLFYIANGLVRLTVLSAEGKAATIAILGKGDFFGDECLASAPMSRSATTVAVTPCSLVQIEKHWMLQALHRDCLLADFFMEYMVARQVRMQEDLADQISHSSEKRLVRVLLLLAGPGTNGCEQNGSFEISQEILAEMVGTTRPRISYFMNKFRKMGLVDYRGGLHVRKELETMLQ